MANTFHVSLHVADLDAAVASYRAILGLEPAKVRPGYAKFEIADPPVILSLTLGEPGTLSHLGIRYETADEVAEDLTRAKSLGLERVEQKDVTCCYARSDKFWVRDADRVPWEMYTLLEDVESETADDPRLRAFLAGSTAASSCGAEATESAACCAPR